jgi:hypothetical protein
MLIDDEGKALNRLINKKLSDDDIDNLIDDLTDGSHYPSNSRVWDIIGAIDEADSAVEIQKLRGKISSEFGYGAVRTPDEFDGDTVMITDPTQIKSAISNTDDFSSENPDIRYSKALHAEVAEVVKSQLPGKDWPNWLRKWFPSAGAREAGDMNKAIRHLTTLSFKAKKYGGPLKEMMNRAMDRVNNRVDIASDLQRMIQPYTELFICS